MPEPLKRILIVDDEKVARDLCVRVLTPLGYEVESAEDGLHAVAFFDSRTFDLVITDLRMPGDLNGLQLCQALKERSPQIKIILMTAFPGIDTAVEMLRMGASDYLIKPFDAADLVRCAANCLSTSWALGRDPQR